MSFAPSDLPLAPGVTLAEVSDAADPKGMGRIKVRFLVAGQRIESDWVPIVSFFAGPQYGAFFLPKVGDSALVAFGEGNPDQPFVLGFLWNGKLSPPAEKAKQQDLRVIRTAKGKQVILDDSAQGRLTLVDEKGNTVSIDTAANTITVDSTGDVAITARGKVTITGADVEVRTKSGSAKLSLSATGARLDGGPTMKLAATMIDIN